MSKEATLERHAVESMALPPHEVLRTADAALDVARFEHRQAKQAVADARQRVQRALANYNAVAPALTPEENVRQWIASNQARKARLAQAGQIPYRPSVTETARAMGGGGHGNDKRAMRGGGGAFRRGAYTKAQAMDIEAGKIRAARADETARMNGSNSPRVKLPSER